MYEDLNPELFNTQLLRVHKLANNLQTRSQLELFVEHVMTNYGGHNQRCDSPDIIIE
jgi:hypothetical protein